jgi:hypothetical protein
MHRNYFVFALSTLLMAAVPVLSHAQNPIDQVGNTADKVGSSIDKVGSLFKKKNKNTSGKNSEKPPVSNSRIDINSVYDFTPGNTVLFIDHFDSTVKGNFPAKWLTNASGEVVTLQQFPGNWFSIVSNGVYIPKLKNGVTKDFTVEFDLIVDGNNNHTLFVDFEDALDGNFSRYPSNPYLQFRIYDGGSAYVENKGQSLDTHVKSSAYNSGGKINHFAIRKDGERLRVYINQEKTFDINQAFEGNRTYSTFKFSTDFYNPTHILVSNVKITGL